MDVGSTGIIEECKIEEFITLIKNKEIILGEHVFFHLTNMQRKIYKVQDIIYMLSKETPRKVYLQANGRFAVFYRKTDGYRKLIIEINEKARVITFMDEIELPRKRL